MLDGRTHRTSAERVDASLLGEEQENWLWQQLDPVQTVQRPIKLLGHGVGLSQGSPAEVVTAYADFWNKLRLEPLFRAGADNDIGRRSLFLAGDIHRTHFVTHEAERIHEVLSSGVACFKPGTGIPSQFTPERFTDNWGLITLDADTVRIDFHGRADKPGSKRPRNFTRVVRRSDWRLVP